MILTETACVDCGEVIPEERLFAVPGAIRCLECQIESEIPRPRRLDHACPRCGSRLVWRVRREGTGDYFIGCAAFPKCRFVDRVSV